jgi:DNA anti-recombination protein RmuC
MNKQIVTLDFHPKINSLINELNTINYFTRELTFEDLNLGEKVFEIQEQLSIRLTKLSELCLELGYQVDKLAKESQILIEFRNTCDTTVENIGKLEYLTQIHSQNIDYVRRKHTEISEHRQKLVKSYEKLGQVLDLLEPDTKFV